MRGGALSLKGEGLKLTKNKTGGFDRYRISAAETQIAERWLIDRWAFCAAAAATQSAFTGVLSSL
jgi:hypothetical protein